MNRSEAFQDLVDAVDAYVEEGTLSVTLPNGYVVVRDATQRYHEVVLADRELSRAKDRLADVARDIAHIANYVGALRERTQVWLQEGHRERPLTAPAARREEQP